MKKISSKSTMVDIIKREILIIESFSKVLKSINNVNENDEGVNQPNQIKAQDLYNFINPIAQGQNFHLNGKAFTVEELIGLAKNTKSMPNNGAVILNDFTNPSFLFIIGKDDSVIQKLRQEINGGDTYKFVGVRKENVNGFIISINRIY
jgi:hypothetical protein